MRYYVKVHSIQGKNRLQEALIKEVEKWRGGLIEDDESREACIEEMRKVLAHYNEAYPKCRPCSLSMNENSISFGTDNVDDTFAIISFHEVRFTYDGIMCWKEKKGGGQ